MATGVTYTNPNGNAIGTPDDDTFIINDGYSAFRLLVAKEGYDTLIVDRSFDNTIGAIILYSEATGLITTVDSRASNAGAINANDFENISITGSSKNDYFEFQSGPVAASYRVALDGGAGDDTLLLNFAAVTQNLNISAASAVVASNYASYANFETFTIIGGSGNDRLEGGSNADEIRGGAGANTLIGGGGDDLLRSSSILDVVDGGAGFDSWFGDFERVQSSMTVMFGADVVINGRTVTQNVERVRLTLGAQSDQITLTRPYDGVLYGGDGADKLILNLDANQALNIAIDTYGANTLEGRVNDFSFYDFEQFVSTGSNGDDQYSIVGPFDPSQISVSGGQGRDRLSINLGTVNTSFELIVGGSGEISSNYGTYAGFETFQLTGGAANDTFVTAGGDDILSGGRGSDTLRGGAGNDTLDGQQGADYIDAGDGDDYIYADTNTDQGADTLVGGQGNDRFFWVSANDQVIELAGGGNDTVEAWTDFTLPDNVETLVLSGQAGIPFGFAVPVTGTGNALDNVILGNDTRNALYGLAGNDTLDGGNGDDTLLGGAGNDILLGNNDHDVLIGGQGSDTIDGGYGNDVVVYQSADDSTMDAADVLRNFEHGRDLIDATALAVTSYGFERVAASGSTPVYTNVTLSLASGATMLIKVDGVASLADFRQDTVRFGKSGADLLNGTIVNDYLAGLEGNDTLNGNAGSDTLQGGTGQDSLTGGTGDDVYVVDRSDDVVVEAAGEGRDTVFAEASYTLASDTEVEVLSTSVNGATSTIALAGNAYAQVIVGDYGNNILTGGGTSRSGDQNDVLIGLRGDDRYVVDSVRTVIFENAGEGADVATVSAAASNFVLNSGTSVETIQAASGTDAINITGNPDAQTIIGNDGANILSGAGGGDTLIGLGGNDTYQVRSSGDQVVEANGGGYDTVFATVSYSLGANEVEVLSTVVQAATDRIDLIGNFASQLVIGNYGDNVLNGGSGGADTLIGLFGDDTYAVGDARVTIVESAGQGNDTVVASVSYQLRNGVSVETLAAQNRSGSDALVLTGNETAQIVAGNDGANTIDGRGGADTLVGGGGADVFAFTTAPASGTADTILDFQAGVDRIGLATDVFAAVTDGGIQSGEFALGTAAQDGDDRLVYDQASGRLFYDADGNGSGAAVLLAQLAAGTALTAASFSTVAPVVDMAA